jgi:hypothetical protein
MENNGLSNANKIDEQSSLINGHANDSIGSSRQESYKILFKINNI